MNEWSRLCAGIVSWALLHIPQVRPSRALLEAAKDVTSADMEVTCVMNCRYM